MKIIRLDSVDSTNRYASEELDFSTTEEFTAVWTSNQYAGKGQAGNVWVSEPGKNLCFTIVFYPVFLNPAHQFMLTKVLSLGTLRFLQQYICNAPIKIKWPNDIYVGSRKIVGMMSENKIIGHTLARTISGIGVNINQTEFSSLAGNPTSIALHAKKTYELEPLVEELRTYIRNYYQLLLENKIEQLDREYLENILFIDELRPYEYNGEEINGTIKGVDEYGFLEIETDKNELLKCDLKEIKYLL